MRWPTRVLAWLYAAASGLVGNAVGADGGGGAGPGSRCNLAEWPCRSDLQCVSQDRYCDGVRDCEDGSDEPPGCSPCNRTYYGRVGRTYSVQVARPSPEDVPHFCQLTFIAYGLEYGDLVQLSIDRFSLGRFTSHTEKGCPDGHMQIDELSRPLGQGFWCGTSWGSNVYYSETSAVNLILRVFNLTETPSSENQGGPNVEEAVLLRLSYRFFRKSEAVLRYGSPRRPFYLGKTVRRTFCDRFFENCDQKICKLQSPNFPGIYPRNLTCSFIVHQPTSPPGKVALVRIKQDNPHMVYIKDRNSPHLKRDRQLALEENCDVLHDFVVVHDGNSTKSPILLKACKGGQLSPITASGPDILVYFHVSPYDFPFQDSPRRNIYGFQFDVEIVFVDIESTAYIRKLSSIPVLPPLLAGSIDTHPPCTWEMRSSARRSGYVQAPEHSVLANTSCTWKLIGGIGEVVWLSFLHYRHVIHHEIPKPARCTNTLTIHDGATKNATMLANVCRTEKYPKVCGAVVSCHPDDTYISKTHLLTITLHYAAGTVASHVEFLARYEFVRRRQWGLQTPNGSSCDRTFGTSPDRLFASPRDVFFFGRGGNKRLRCTYTFKAGRDQLISLSVIRARMGDHCTTILHGSSKRYECSNRGSDDYPSLWVVENLWPGVELRRACFCDVNQAVNIISYTNKLQIIFHVPHMGPSDDYSDFFFEGEYEMIRAGRSSLSRDCSSENRKYDIPHGNFTLGAGGFTDSCASLPRFITPPDGGFLFLTVNGFQASDTNCGIGSRINVYGVGGYSPLMSICPELGKEMTQVFSDGWERRPYYNRTGPIEPSRALIVEYTGNYSGRAVVNWISVWRPVTMSLTAPSVGCPHRCPEISACLPEELWCNREPNCPSQADETAAACGLLVALPWVTVVVAGTMLLALLILLIAVITRRRPQKSKPLVIDDYNNFDSLPKVKKKNKKNKKTVPVINDFGSIGRISNNSAYFTPTTKKPPAIPEDYLLPPDGAS